MNDDDFERQLGQRPLRPVPAEWRGKILAAARASVLTPVARPEGPSRPAPSFLSALFWPSPKAWAGLAAVWLGILAVNHATSDKSPVMAQASLPPSPETIRLVREQRRELAQLLEPWEPPPAEPPKPFVPRPRGELRTMITMV